MLCRTANPHLSPSLLKGGDYASITAPAIPNITGQFNNNGNSRGGGSADGAFYVIKKSGVFSNSSGASDGGTYGFDASLISTIYKDVNDMRLPAIIVMPQIKF